MPGDGQLHRRTRWPILNQSFQKRIQLSSRTNHCCRIAPDGVGSLLLKSQQMIGDVGWGIQMCLKFPCSVRLHFEHIGNVFVPVGQSLKIALEDAEAAADQCPFRATYLWHIEVLRWNWQP